jgi:UDP-N-acetylmuramate--alanine ligase
MTDIYAAREKNIHKISSSSLVAAINERYPEKDAKYFSRFNEVVAFVRENAKQGDLVITMGAGDIYKVGEMILEMDHLGDEVDVTRGAPIR